MPVTAGGQDRARARARRRDAPPSPPATRTDASRRETSALAPASPDADVAETYLVTGGSDGNVRFFDVELRLVAWFDGLGRGRGHERLVRRDRAERERRKERRSRRGDEPTKTRSSRKDLRPSPRLISSSPRTIRSCSRFVPGDFNAFGSDEASRARRSSLGGATEPAVALAAHRPTLCFASPAYTAASGPGTTPHTRWSRTWTSHAAV